MTKTLRMTRPGTRLSAVAASSAALLAFGLAAPAAADPVHGEYNGQADSGPRVHMEGGNTYGTSLFTLELEDGSKLSTYCIDADTDIRTSAQYVEGDWADYPGKGEFAKPGKVHWILQNSHPNVELDELAAESGVDDLNERDAIAGTQAAIWYYSNDTALDTDDRRNSDEVTAVYEYLVEDADELESGGEPNASLSFDPKEASGHAGEIIGEFTVDTNAEEISPQLDGPEGVEIVDLDGNAVDSLADGDTFGLNVPEDAEPGEATVSAQTSAEARTGRLFQGIEDQDFETQTLIVAQSETVEAESSVEVSWEKAPDDDETPPPDDDETPPPEDDKTPPPDEEKPPADDKKPENGDEGDQADDQLPVTGAQLGGLIAAAVVALGGGAAALFLARKRRSAAALDS
ncbi:thioester domain-containing protein [Lipingzhangella sp. LS1_29]|uniref:Thioester domain-containing protein n=1 Tax=Lipingzhangella rawalii TaxID=2055835 RepID=A0ABU2H9R1_9ACTN|nr:thioester domain-containing protein [Lipingzhangella rawalii]MDS1272011.1 thioester domain-containing protein [Lipingzhangella rawalii]